MISGMKEEPMFENRNYLRKTAHRPPEHCRAPIDFDTGTITIEAPVLSYAGGYGSTRKHTRAHSVNPLRTWCPNT